MGATFWSSPLGDLPSHFIPSLLRRGLHYHDEVAGRSLKQGLDWCSSHLMTCKFQSVLFLTDSQSALSILSSAPSYLLPESLWNVRSIASSLSNNTTLSFQWVPGHAGLPGNQNADYITQVCITQITDDKTA